MCFGLIFDVLVVIAVILLIVWILALAGVVLVATGPVIHVLIVIAIILAIVWLLSFVLGWRGAGYGYGRRGVAPAVVV
jgi:hypothetical protein